MERHCFLMYKNNCSIIYQFLGAVIGPHLNSTHFLAVLVNVAPRLNFLQYIYVFKFALFILYNMVHNFLFFWSELKSKAFEWCQIGGVCQRKREESMFSRSWADVSLLQCSVSSVYFNSKWRQLSGNTTYSIRNSIIHYTDL